MVKNNLSRGVKTARTPRLSKIAIETRPKISRTSNKSDLKTFIALFGNAPPQIQNHQFFSLNQAHSPIQKGGKGGK